MVADNKQELIKKNLVRKTNEVLFQCKEQHLHLGTELKIKHRFPSIGNHFPQVITPPTLSYCISKSMHNFHSQSVEDLACSK